VGYGGKGTKQNPFNPAKNGGIGADSEREAKNRQKGKAGIAAQYAESKAQILERIFDEIDAARFAAFLFDLFHSAQRPQRGVAGLFHAHSTAHVLLNLLLKMELQLVVEFLVGLAPAEDGTQPKLQSVMPAHWITPDS
jgi:hypothetical protein